MTTALKFDPIRLPKECEDLREEVRAFIREEVAAGTWDPNAVGRDDAFNYDFAKKVGKKGWIGLTWPKKYGGHERTFLERYVVTEEFRAAKIMQAKGWLPGLVQKPKAIHRMMSMIHAPALDEYLADVRAAVGVVRQEGTGSASIKATY